MCRHGQRPRRAAEEGQEPPTMDPHTAVSRASGASGAWVASGACSAVS
eukprot:CAMPEP_0204608064 /NCGR_PEP_ID=MMETSP0661-20131031/60090_1 /ASSEMBLY_ACC=CAM_ASM_000606 /TAXON_ID=109239 /ORGANISM="Alexandrium margalefi, Strain AMGDE01CS-322" /LENGTH=47 /DNA_ID= /DNA_START= /DNA_END= /DNA_ORIENTATION=